MFMACLWRVFACFRVFSSVFECFRVFSSSTVWIHNVGPFVNIFRLTSTRRQDELECSLVAVLNGTPDGIYFWLVRLDLLVLPVIMNKTCREFGLAQGDYDKTKSRQAQKAFPTKRAQICSGNV